MGHIVGLPGNYLRELKLKLPLGYQKVVPHLTNNGFEKSVLLQKVEQLEAEKESLSTPKKN